MTTDPAFERFVEALNAPASAAELAAEAEVVSTMHGLVSPATGATMILKMIFGHKVAAATAAVVIGTTGAAAANGAVPFLVEDDPVETEVVVELEDVEQDFGEVEELQVDEVADEVEEAATTEEIENDVVPPVDENEDPYCEDAENHGDDVSGVAGDDSIDGPRGQVVSQAVHTDCGMYDDDSDQVDVDDRDEADIDEYEDDEYEDDEYDDDEYDDDEYDEHDDDGRDNGHRGNEESNNNDD